MISCYISVPETEKSWSVRPRKTNNLYNLVFLMILMITSLERAINNIIWIIYKSWYFWSTFILNKKTINTELYVGFIHFVLRFVIIKEHLVMDYIMPSLFSVCDRFKFILWVLTMFIFKIQHVCYMGNL
jgi:hypothetical protein